MAARTTTSDTLLKWCDGTWLQHAGVSIIRELAIDTRKISRPEDAIFIAIVSQHRNGHGFISAAYEKGIRNFLVSENVNTNIYKGANFIKVPDTVEGLQKIATEYRRQFNIPVIGITGSNGKTIVKEWLFQLLGTDLSVLRSPKSYNSQIGVPLSVWLLEPEHELAVFEAGISQPGEMGNLERMVQPSIGVFTNIGEAHNEGFLSLRQKIKEKLLLFRQANYLVYCKDYPELNECIAYYASQLRNNDDKGGILLFTWSAKIDADLKITETYSADGKTIIRALYQGNAVSVTIPFTDAASIENAIHCWAVLLLLGNSNDLIEERMQKLLPVSMRLELKQGINNCTIINDAYNSDITSLLIALDYVAQQKQHPYATVVLSDMLQVGKPDADLYDEVAEMVVRRGIKRFIGVGQSLYKNKARFRKHKKLRSIFFKTTEDFLKNLHLLTFNNETVLLKGARIFKFEKISLLLEQQVHQTVLSINLTSLAHNLTVFRSLVAPGVKIMAMVKAFSYGSGSYEIAHLLQYSGVDYLSVAFTDEGITLRRAGITLPIMVMSPDLTSFDRMIAWNLEPEIFNSRSLDAFVSIARTLNVRDYPVHVKFDTGMHRLGFMPDEIDELGKRIVDNEYLRVASVFSHLAASENPAQDNFTSHQARVFESMCGKLTDILTYSPLCHICNSAAIARHPGLHYDMVRLGLGLYGIASQIDSDLQQNLRQVGTLKTTVAQIKTIPASDTVGYGREGVTDKEMRIATINIGYADGYPRALGNGNGYVYIHSKKAKTVGVICMDMCMVDITEIPEAREGDAVTIFSPDLPLTTISEMAGTIPYEIMTGISQRVKRIYERES